MMLFNLSRRLVRLLVVGGVLTAALLVPVGSAQAGPIVECPDTNPRCTIEDSDTGNQDGGGDGSDWVNPNTCLADGTYGQIQVACYDEDFGSYVGDGCWLRPARENTNPPPEGATVPGFWATRACMDPLNETGTFVWIAGNLAPTLTPEQLARRALASITLLPADIQIAPDPAGSGLVGLPVWMWTTVNSNTWGVPALTATDTDAGLTVSIEARAVSIAWDMGDGRIVRCNNPGTPYEARFGDAASPTCGHVYVTPSRDQPGGVFTVTARTTWEVSWSGGGESGVIPQFRQSQTTVRIGELQVVTE